MFLSHTHVTLQADDGSSYDVAIDNVFANLYQRNRAAVPPPLNSIRVGDRLEVCGETFPGGIHWVHTDCGATRPSTGRTAGFARWMPAAAPATTWKPTRHGANSGRIEGAHHHALAPEPSPSSRQTNSMVAATKQRIFEITFSASGSGASGKAKPNAAQTAKTANIPATA